MSQTNAERQKAYRQRNAVTERNVTPDRNGWPWDEKHIYQICPHGKRYCRSCGTAAEPFTASVEQWAEAYRTMLASAERNKGSRNAEAK